MEIIYACGESILSMFITGKADKKEKFMLSKNRIHGQNFLSHVTVKFNNIITEC